MPIFLIGKFWLVAMTFGMICLFIKGSRHLSAHFILGSTLGMILSFAFQALMPSAAVASMVAGALVGVLTGSILAFQLNLLLGIGKRTG